MDFYRLKLSKSKLKAISGTSSLMSGFAMVAMVELNLENYSIESSKKNNEYNYETSPSFETLNMTSLTNQTQLIPINVENKSEEKFLIPEFVLVFFVFVTSLLVGVHMLALMISTCILPQVEATSEQMEFEQQIYNFDKKQLKKDQKSASKDKKNFDQLKGIPSRKDTQISDDETVIFANSYLSPDLLKYPHQKFHRFIELAWIMSTVIGIFLFLVEIGLICFIKFYPLSTLIALTATIVMTPILILFLLFTFTFYKKIADYKLNVTQQFLANVDRNLSPLHEHIV